jgi:chlorobactene glucosyltransferase
VGSTVLALIAALSAGAALVSWLVILTGVLTFRRDHLTIRSRAGDADETRDVPVSVIVPAHDEAVVLKECLHSLLAQSHAAMEIIVVDDRSVDATGAIAGRLAALDRRVRVVRVDDLPPGWTGKTNALARGVAAARGEWLLFTDADTLHEPGCLAACLRHAVERRIVLLSGWPALALRSRIAALIDPLCGGVLASWYRRRGIETGRRFAPFANGQYLLVRRDAFDRVGGFDSIKQRLLEDIALAGLMDREGLPFETVLLREVLRVRSYASCAESRRAWSRIFVHGALANVRRLVRRAIALPFLGLAGPAAIVVGLADPRAPDSMLASLLGLLATAAMTCTTALVYRQARLPLAYALAAPVAAVLSAFFLAEAARDAWTARPVEWHGVRYPGGIG